METAAWIPSKLDTEWCHRLLCALEQREISELQAADIYRNLITQSIPFVGEHTAVSVLTNAVKTICSCIVPAIQIAWKPYDEGREKYFVETLSNSFRTGFEKLLPLILASCPVYLSDMVSSRELAEDLLGSGRVVEFEMLLRHGFFNISMLSWELRLASELCRNYEHYPKNTTLYAAIEDRVPGFAEYIVNCNTASLESVKFLLKKFDPERKVITPTFVERFARDTDNVCVFMAVVQHAHPHVDYRRVCQMACLNSNRAYQILCYLDDGEYLSETRHPSFSLSHSYEECLLAFFRRKWHCMQYHTRELVDAVCAILFNVEINEMMFDLAKFLNEWDPTKECTGDYLRFLRLYMQQFVDYVSSKVVVLTEHKESLGRFQERMHSFQVLSSLDT